jgi:hypothetical protein
VRITYDRLPEGRRHPLGRDACRDRLAALARDPAVPLDRIKAFHFGWNARTTQEGCVVQRDDHFDIRINFTIMGEHSRILEYEPRWLGPATKCGGVVLSHEDRVHWPPGAAERYCWFLVLHELAHLVYANKHTGGNFEGRGGASAEETFCDQWALARALAAK